MKDKNDRVILLIFTFGLIALVLALFNFWVPFGLAVFGILVLTLALGFGPARRGGMIRRFLIFLSLAYVLIFAGMVWFDRTTEGLHLVLGLPAATAFLVYGIWIVPASTALLYGLVFRSSVLPEDKIKQFLADHGSKGRKN